MWWSQGLPRLHHKQPSRLLWISARAKYRLRARLCLILRWMQVAFAQPNLTDADLRGLSLEDANLSGANLSRTMLYWAHLERADLTGAILYGADLTDANLDGVIGADFTGALNVPANYLKD
jgi:uncharacterized protein YjbI with pentapeptide repeats